MNIQKKQNGKHIIHVSKVQAIMISYEDNYTSKSC